MEENCEQDRLMVGVKTLARHLRAEHTEEDVLAHDEMIQPALRAAPGETGWSMGIPRDAASPKQGGGGEAKVHWRHVAHLLDCKLTAAAGVARLTLKSTHFQTPTNTAAE